MRVLISGGGIAGLTLAYWLHHYDIPSVVIEQAGAIRRDGYAIDFLGTGYEVAERMSLIDRLRSQQIPFDLSGFSPPQATSLESVVRRTLALALADGM